ncbi:MAG: hypothetical protein WCS66_07315, partial [Bacteroidales bacterium]
EQLKQLLMLADFVKFAKFNPLESENQQALNHAYGFVEKTMPEEPLNTEYETKMKASAPVQDKESV